MSGNVKYSFERCEKKYFLTPLQQEFLLCRMSRHMSADRYGKYKICNIYYDADDWRLIRASIDKPVYKEKLRVRSYGVPDEGGSVFVELKKKYDGVVYKRRITAEPETAELDKLFDRFYRADKSRSSGGFGIGLSIARSIAEGHKGSIKAVSPDGRTIEFIAELK